MKAIKRQIKKGINNTIRLMWGKYTPPILTDNDRGLIETDIRGLFDNQNITDYHINSTALKRFEDSYFFRDFYDTKWNRYKRKVCEYYMVENILKFNDEEREEYVYLDLMSSSSPWAWAIKKRYSINSYAVDIQKPSKPVECFVEADVTKLPFDCESVDGISIQSGMELLSGNDDMSMLREAERVLKPGGRMIISPMYIYKEPVTLFGRSYYREGQAEDGTKKYMRLDFNIPFTRLYSVDTLKSRVLDVMKKVKWSLYIVSLDDSDELYDTRDTFIYLRYVLAYKKEL